MTRGRLLFPILMMALFAATRWPGVMPPDFSAAYAIAFCAGVYFRRAWSWSLPLGTLLLSDVIINVLFYHTDALNPYMAVNYLAYLALLRLGRAFPARASWPALTAGGVLGAALFYLITNSFSWWENPAYPKTLAGWIQALTVGTPGWPATWEFFRNTLSSGGLFAGLFAGAVKLSEESAEEREETEPETEEGESEPAPEEIPSNS